MKKTLFLLAVVGVWFAHWQLHRPITYPPGILIASDPTQVNLPSNEPEFGFGDFHLKPLARFAIDARLLHSKIYRYDRGASLVPIDLAVGWGPMSDQQVLDHLQVSQSMRFFLVRIQNAASNRGRTNCQSRHQYSHHSVDARVGGSLQIFAFWSARSSWWRIGPGNRSANRNVAQFIEPFRFGQRRVRASLSGRFGAALSRDGSEQIATGPALKLAEWAAATLANRPKSARSSLRKIPVRVPGAIQIALLRNDENPADYAVVLATISRIRLSA